jgi:hypothetical protein
MRHVDLRIDQSVVFHIECLRGLLLPTYSQQPASFDDKRSFAIKIEDATIGISAPNIGDLLNKYVLAYPGAPITGVKISIRDRQLTQIATVHKGVPVRVEMAGSAAATPEGVVRFAPNSFKVAGVPAKGLLDLLGVEIEKLIHVREDRGMRITGNDIFLDLNRFPIAPRLYGRVAQVHLKEGMLIEDFGKRKCAAADLITPIYQRSYMYFRGGSLRFGKLEMRDSDLEIVSEQNKDWLYFYLDRYNDQLVAGYNKVTSSRALISFIPDFSDTPK